MPDLAVTAAAAVDDDAVVPIASFVGVTDDATAMVKMLPTSTVLDAHSKVEYLIDTFLSQTLAAIYDTSVPFSVAPSVEKRTIVFSLLQHTNQ